MFNHKTIQRIERILTNDVVDRCARTTKFAIGGGAALYATWRGLDYHHGGAGLTACLMFASLSTLLGVTALALLISGDEPEGG
jgi:hypothetical protein